MNRPHTLLLFDVDGVLVHPVGYKAAMRATINYFSGQMGQPDFGPDDDEIAVFEACGITNEWDSSALCVTAMLLAAVDADSTLRRASLDETLAAIRETGGITLARPDYGALARMVPPGPPGEHSIPTRRYLAHITGRTEAETLPLIAALLNDVYSIDTPTTRIFQTHTLGSERFAETYGIEPPVETPSLLAEMDRPLLSDANRARLLAWVAPPERGAVIFTARPSLPPASVTTAAERDGYAPEAELAAELVGLMERVPLIAQGRVGWLARQRGRNAADFIKPSPVQALAAIAAAASGAEREALEAAAALAEDGVLSAPLADLCDGPVEVVVFEDSVGGIRATQDAVTLLRRAGIDARCHGIGVSPHPDKRAALREVADRVVDDVNAGLARVFEEAHA